MKKIFGFLLTIVFITMFAISSFAAQVLLNPKFQAFDDNGDPLSGGLVYTYVNGTTTDKATYTTVTLGVANANPVVLDTRGEADIHLSGVYTIVLKTSAGVAIWTLDDVEGQGSTIVDFVQLSDYADLPAAITAIGATETTLYIDDDDTLGANATIPSTTSVVGMNGHTITTTGFTLTINGPFDAGRFQVFAGTGTVTFGDGAIKRGFPEWWGAVGDNATDCSVPIAAGLTSCSLHFGRGTYICNNTALVSDRIISGEGPGISIIKLKAATDDELFEGTSLNDIIIKDLEIDGNDANQTVAANLLHFTTCTNIRIENCYIHDSEKDAIYFTDCEDSWVTNNLLKDNLRNGVSCGSGTDTSLRMHINNNIIDGHNGANDIGIALEPAFNSEVVGNILIDNYNAITVVDQAAMTEECSGNIISSNSVYATAAQNYGIIVRGDADEADYNTVANNTFFGELLNGIYLHTVSYCTVTGNTIHDSAVASSSAIVLNTATYNVVNGNSIFGQQDHGITASAADYNTINGNLIYDCSKGAAGVKHGISISNSDWNTISGNMISGADHASGIGITGTGESNTLYGNNITGGTNAVVTANEVNVIDGFISSETASIDLDATGYIETITLPQDFDLRYRTLRISAAGRKTGATANKTIKLYLGASNFTFHAAANDTNDWQLEVEIEFYGVNIQRVKWRGWNGTTLAAGYEAWTEDISAGTLALRTHGTLTAGDHIFQDIWTVEVF